MRQFFRIIGSIAIFPIGWTLFTIILLCLPGSAIPGNGIFALPGLDKIVHIVLFGGIVWLWASYSYYKLNKDQWKRMLCLLVVCTLVLGIILEFVQKYFIPGRSFDNYDIVADATGAVLAALGQRLWR